MLARQDKVARIILVGPEEEITQQIKDRKGDMDGITVQDPTNSPIIEELAQLYYETRKHKGVTNEEASRLAQKPHVYAALLVKKGFADGTIGGAVETTGEIVRAAIQVIGTSDDTALVSSFFLILLCKEHHDKKGAYIFADAGLVVHPTADEMSEIACMSAKSYLDLVDDTPRIAMLSFSTYGSSEHDAVSKVVTATDLVRKKDPHLLVDGELQFDAAFVPDIAKSKASDSPLGGVVQKNLADDQRDAPPATRSATN